jgi:zinc protease
LTAAAFRVHPYGHPTIGWLPDLQTMTREDLYGHYRRFYIPNNATIVIVGDVETDAVLARVEHHFGAVPSGKAIERKRSIESAQQAERRVHFRKEGTTAYWRAAFHAPAVADDDFFPMLFVDAALSGASGLNIWSGHKVPTPQRSARLYRATVDTGLAANVGGAVLPTEDPFLYYIWATVAGGKTLRSVEDAVLTELERVARDGITEAELTKVRAQLRARFVYDGDSVTDIAHQLGYFETIGSWRDYHDLIPRLGTVTLDQVNAAARKYLQPDNRTIGWFEPTLRQSSGQAHGA